MTNEPENPELELFQLKSTCEIMDSVHKRNYENFNVDSKEWTEETLKKDIQTAFWLAKEIIALPIKYVPFEIVKKTNHDMKKNQ